jgi:hypothetical protein
MDENDIIIRDAAVINLSTKTVVTTTATVVATVFAMHVAGLIITPHVRRLTKKLEKIKENRENN